MKVILRSLSLAVLFVSFAYGVSGGTISGVVKDPDGAPFRGAFVRARNQKTKITMSVLSDKQGRYSVMGLPAGSYDVRATAIGFGDDQQSAVTIAPGDQKSMDFGLKKGMVRWSDLTSHQGKQLLPEGKGKDNLVENCFACHQFQTRMAAMPRDRAGWNTAMKLMRIGIAYRMANVTDQDAEEMITYLDKYFGKNPALPKSPADLPTYKETVRPFSDEAMKIEYVDYEMPSPNVFPWSGAPDAKGNIWIPFFGAANRIAKLDQATGEVEEFRVPFTNAAGIHSAYPAQDGTVWLAEQGSNRVGKWDPVTRKITEYQDKTIADARGGGGKVTTRVDSKGIVWSTGHPFSRLDPKTGEFTHYPEIPNAYGMAIDKQDNVWFTALEPGKSIGRVDAKTGKVTRWEPPTPRAWPRRMAFDSQGILWFGEYYGGKIGRFDPKTETFKEYQLPGADPTPYAMGVDKKDRIWYSSMYMNVVGCLDPKTGKIVEYPIPYSENTMREFFFDSQGRMWFGSPANNRVGYFTLKES